MDPQGAWPPPHSSPPRPPPREYGSPGTPPARHPWLWAALTAVVVGAAVSFGLVALIGSGGDDAGVAADPTESAAPTTTSATQSTAPPAAVRCWDGSGAQAVSDCPLPDGAAGLAWVYPHLAEQHCGKPTHPGPGVVLRILCAARLSDGSRVQLGYYQWKTVDDGVEFYADQDLEQSDADGFHTWTGRSGDTLKSAALYVDAPFSLTVTLPADVVATKADLQAFQSRPPDQVRGEPVA